jgi:hypothetical protein
VGDRNSDLFDEAFAEFIVREADSIGHGVHEQNLSGLLSQYIAARMDKYGLKAYYVDPEYNLKQNQSPKTILKGGEVFEIRPDIIVHSRGEQEPDNLLAIEMKKAGATAEVRRRRENDRERLNGNDAASWHREGATCQPNYAFGKMFAVMS